MSDPRPTGDPRVVVPPLAEWPEQWGEEHPSRNVWMLVAGVVLVVIAALFGVTAAGETARLGTAAVVGVFGITALALAGRTPFGRGRFQFLNAVTLTRARIAPPDSWVHFARERRVGFPLLVVFGVWATALTAVAVAALSIGFGGRPQAFLGFVFVALFALVFGYGFVRGVMAQYRLDSFGRRPVGVSVGPSGIALLMIGEPVYIPWDAVRGVDADLTAPPRHGSPIPVIRLRLDRSRVRTVDGGRARDQVVFAPTSVRLHPRVLWTVLQVCASSPEARSSLGTTFGQQTLDAWCTAAERR